MIIIKIPQPDTEGRLVVVPPSCISDPQNDGTFTIRTQHARDATPDDLARGGYVPVERAEKAEWSARVARMALANEHQDREGVRIRKDLGTQDAPCPCDTDPEQGMGMHSPPCPLHEAARALRRKTSWEDAAHTMDGELKAAITRAEKAERERDEEKRHAGDAADALARLMRERDAIRAEVARLTAPGEGSDGALRATTLAVAARVRKERCLVAQAVGMGVRYMAIFLEMGGRWGVVVGERVASAQAPSEVPTTLARLLGEVGK